MASVWGWNVPAALGARAVVGIVAVRRLVTGRVGTLVLHGLARVGWRQQQQQRPRRYSHELTGGENERGVYKIQVADSSEIGEICGFDVSSLREAFI